MPTKHVNGYDLNYAEAGSGPTVLMIHGTLQDQRYWAPQMAPFGTQFHAVALSLRHFWPARWDGLGGGFTIDQHVEDVAGFIRALAVGPVRLIGHSRGGHIAFRVAERFPELLHSLILAEPGGELDDTLGGKPATGVQAKVFAKGAELVGAGAIDDGLRVVAEHTGGAGAWEKRTAAHKQVSHDNAMTMLGQIDEQRRPFSRAAAQAIRTRTLLVGGADTQPNFIANLDALERTIAGATRVTIPHAAHGMSADNPAAFNAAVLAFLAT